MKLSGAVRVLNRADSSRPAKKAAIQTVKRLAGRGDAEARFTLACFHEWGVGVPRDRKKAYQLFREGALAGDAASQYELGNCYRMGIGIRRDAKEALRWYRKAKDPKKALAWYRRAARKGHADAMHNVAYYYEHGKATQLRKLSRSR